MTYQRSFPRSLPKWRDWKEYWTPSRTKYARRVRHQQNTYPWPSTRHVSFWRWRNPLCIITLNGATFLPQRVARTICYSRMSLFNGRNQVEGMARQWLQKSKMQLFLNPTKGNLIVSDHDCPNTLPTQMCLRHLPTLLNLSYIAVQRVIGRLCDVCPGEYKSWQTRVLLFAHIPRSLLSNDTLFCTIPFRYYVWQKEAWQCHRWTSPPIHHPKNLSFSKKSQIFM